MQTPELVPIFATIQDMRIRVQNCSGCAQRRELIQRWLAGEHVKMQGIMPNPPRDMSVLMKEK